MEVTVNIVEAVTLPLQGHSPTEAETALLAGVGVSVMTADTVGMRVMSDAFIELHILLVVREGGSNTLPGRLLVCLTKRKLC